MADWQNLHDTPAPENITLETKIDDRDGCRNDQTLMRRGNLWWYPDGSMYVYYTPTHWRYHEPLSATATIQDALSSKTSDYSKPTENYNPAGDLIASPETQREDEPQ